VEVVEVVELPLKKGIYIFFFRDKISIEKLLLITVVGTDLGRAGGFSRIITGEGVRGGGGR
jgi:hypothetical protein